MYHNDFEPFERNTENLTESEPLSAYGQPQQTAPGYTPQHSHYAEEPVHYESYNTTAAPQGSGYAEEPVHYEPYNTAGEPQGSGYAAEPVPNESYNTAGEPQGRKKKKSKKTVGVVAAAVAAGVMLSGVAGFGGSYLFSKLNTPSNNTAAVQINKASTDNNISNMSVQQTDKSTNEIVNEVADSVVEIKVEIMQSNPFYGQSVAEGAGSGVIISEDGYILTNNHVISEASSSGSKINVLTYDGTTYSATVVGTDSSNDLAVLKIDASDCVPVTFGSSSDMSVGDTVYAVGNPMGELQFTMTSGMVSALDRDVTTEESGGAINMFQMDAAINSGNSGGPVYNANGEVIGVATAKYSSSGSDATVEGLGFAIPSDDAKKISNDLMTNGYVTGKAKMGVSIDQNYSSTVAQYYDMPEGAYVKYVETGSAAEKAGIQPGDIITKCGDKTIEGYEDLTNAIKSYSAGDTVEITVYRSGNESTLSITFDEANATQQQAATQQQQQQGNFFGFGGMPNAQSGAYISR